MLAKIQKLKKQTFYFKDCYLKKLSKKNCNKKYLSWMNNKEINKYLEFRFEKQKIVDLLNFVKGSNLKKNCILFGIFKNRKHIGNIKLDLDINHKFGIIGYVIGDKKNHNKNIGSMAIKKMVDIAFKNLKLRFCYALIYKINIPSSKVLLKNNFKEIFTEKNKYIISKNKFVDEVTYKIENKIKTI